MSFPSSLSHLKIAWSDTSSSTIILCTDLKHYNLALSQPLQNQSQHMSPVFISHHHLLEWPAVTLNFIQQTGKKFRNHTSQLPSFHLFRFFSKTPSLFSDQGAMRQGFVKCKAPAKAALWSLTEQHREDSSKTLYDPLYSPTVPGKLPSGIRTFHSSEFLLNSIQVYRPKDTSPVLQILFEPLQINWCLQNEN